MKGVIEILVMNEKLGHKTEKKEPHRICKVRVMRLVSNKFMSLFLFFKREKLTEEY